MPESKTPCLCATNHNIITTTLDWIQNRIVQKEWGRAKELTRDLLKPNLRDLEQNCGINLPKLESDVGALIGNLNAELAGASIGSTTTIALEVTTRLGKCALKELKQNGR